MKKLLVLAGLATALGLAVPAAAQAVTIAPAVGVQGGTQIQLAGGKHGHHGHHGYRGHRGHGRHHYGGPAYRYRPPAVHHYYRPPPVVHHYHHAPRPWSYWQPYVVRHHYHSFGAPVYYSGHPHYGQYYRVRARDRNNVAVWLGISAITGAILFSNY